MLRPPAEAEFGRGVSLMVRAFGTTIDWNAKTYGADRHPDLPWGYWLTSIGKNPGAPPLVDEDGRQYSSVRDAFWRGRLGLPPLRRHYNERTPGHDILSFIMWFLATLDQRFVTIDESRLDIFRGNGHLQRFFIAFLVSHGLVDVDEHRPTPEGRAVLMMLMATRSNEEVQDGVGIDWVAATNFGASSEARRNALEMAAERQQTASRMKHRFARDTLNGRPVVTFISFKMTREIPLRSTVWSMSWERGDEHSRDRFYLWLLERIDRWDAWSELISRGGTRALTEHLMKLAFCDRFADGIVDDSGSG